MRLQEDSLLGPLNQQFIQTILNQKESAQELIAKLEAVTLDDVAKVAKRLQLVASAQLLQKTDVDIYIDED